MIEVSFIRCKQNFLENDNVKMEKNMQKYQVVVIGAGPGGIEAAKHAAHLGFETLIISNTKIGGRATWSSLVPSKVWLATAHKFHVSNNLSGFGIDIQGAQINLDAIKTRIKLQSVKASEKHVSDLERYKVDIQIGTAKIIGENLVEITDENGSSEQIEAEKIIIASGSGPRFFPTVKPNKKRIIAPKLAPILPEIPKNIVILGGGVTGMEFAFTYAALGSEVTVIHNKAEILPGFDVETVTDYRQYLAEEYGIKFVLNDAVKSAEQVEEQVHVETASGQKFTFDYAFIAIGRKADLGFFDESQIKIEIENGVVKANEFCQTNFANIYAIGDAIGEPMMVNKALMQARLATHHMKEGDESSYRSQDQILAVYTEPAIAQIGSISQSDDIQVVVKKYTDNLKANVKNETDGYLKLFVEKSTQKIIGACGFGSHVTDVMAAVQIVVNNELTLKDMKRIPKAHPSISELISQMD